MKNLAAAMVKAQREMENPSFDATNPHFRSKYASLLEVTGTVIPVLNRFGIAVQQWPICKTEGEKMFAGCRTVLIHESGEMQESDCLLPLDKPNAHGAGSCITYARRYALMAIAGVVGDDDDDGNSAVDSDKGKITPAAGIKDTLKPAQQRKVEGVASSIVDCFQAFDMERATAEAWKMLEEAQFDAEEKIFCWTFLDSRQRSAIKKYAQSVRSRGELATQG